MFAKAVPGNSLEMPVICSHTTHYDYVLGTGLEHQCGLQSFLRLRHGPHPGEMRIELQFI